MIESSTKGNKLSSRAQTYFYQSNGFSPQVQRIRPFQSNFLHGRSYTRRQQSSSKALNSREGVEEELLPEAPKWPASPFFLATTVTGFLAIITDIFGESGARWLLNNIDKPTHNWVVSHIPKTIRDIVFELGISNVSIVLGCVGWAVCTSLVISDALDEWQEKRKVMSENPPSQDLSQKVEAQSLGPKNVVRLASAWLLYWTAGGFKVPGDNYLVHFIKYKFNRARPSNRLKSFSFPSGHSTAVAFIVGMVLFAFLPWILEIVNRRLKEKNEAKLGILKSPVIQGIAKSALKNASYLWPFSIVATVSGRVCGDVHWVTDTLAGACLGASLVSIFLFISTAIDRQKLQN